MERLASEAGVAGAGELLGRTGISIRARLTGMGNFFFPVLVVDGVLRLLTARVGVCNEESEID